MKNTWNGIKSIISIRSASLIIQSLLAFQNDNPKIIENISNNYFSTIGEKTQAKIKYSHKDLTNMPIHLIFHLQQAAIQIKNC